MKSTKTIKPSETHSGMSFSMICMLLIYSLSLFCGPNLLGQTPKTTGAISPGQRKTYVKTGSNYSMNITDFKVGYEKIGTTVKYYEQGMTWNVNIIPQNATITSCVLNFNSGVNNSGAPYDGSIVLTGIPWNFYNNSNAQTVYDWIKDGPSYGTVTVADNKLYTISLPSLVPDVQDAIESTTPNIGLGAYNSGVPQGYGTSFGSSNLNLIVNYTIPTPPKPKNLRITSVTAVSFILAWDASTGNVSGYNVYKNGQYYGTTSSTTMLISGLCPATSYPLYIIPYNNYGPGEQSETKNFSTNAYSVEGNTTVCSSSNTTFTFKNRPSGVSINWTQSSNIQYISGQGTDQYTVRALSGGSGWVKATVSSISGCTTTTEYNYPVWSGAPVVSVTGPAEGCTNTQYTFQAHTNNPENTYPFSYTWEIYPYDGYISTSNVGNYAAYAYITFYNEYSVAGYQVKARAENLCGVGNWGSTAIWIQECLDYLLSPNPASENVTVTMLKSSVNNSNITTVSDRSVALYEVSIIDLYGSLFYSSKESGDSFIIPVNNLKNGNYIVRITDGKQSVNKQLIVKH